MNEIIPVLLAGGVGSRLWPLSRENYPKQFLNILNKYSPFQETAIRLKSSNNIKFKQHITVTNSEFRFFVVQQLLDIGIDPGPIIIEPESKNTAPAILSAALFTEDLNNDCYLLVAPSDHFIPNTKAFHEAVISGIKEVENGNFVTFGIKPTHPETGYGYLELERLEKYKNSKILKFIEKPNKNLAKKLISVERYLWNSGIFMFKPSVMIEAFRQHAPDILATVQESIKKSKKDLGFLRLDPDAWSKSKNVSIDYAIMEKVKNLSVVPFNELWSDLGSWESVWKIMNPNKDGVSLSSHAHAFECKNSLLRSGNKNQEIIGLGLENIIAVATHDAVLVANKDKVQDIKKIVSTLKSKKISQSTNSFKEYRPWGWFEIINKSTNYQVKKIHVNPQSSLSLQSHNHRSEHWIIVRGKAKITIQKETKLMRKGESIFVPKRSIHKIENPYKLSLKLIEIQLGSYLGEDDIIRYEDIYSRL